MTMSDDTAGDDGGKDLVTRIELLQLVAATGRTLTDRNLTYYTSERLLPRSQRTGSDVGRYPFSTVGTACWVIDCRSNGLPIPAIRELLPLHTFLAEAARTQTASTSAVQRLVDGLSEPDAVREVPWLLRLVDGVRWDVERATLIVGNRVWHAVGEEPSAREVVEQGPGRPVLRGRQQRAVGATGAGVDR